MLDNSQKIRLGWISYLNLYPLLCEIKEQMPDDFEIIRGHPRDINEKLARSFVDLAPSSSICLLNDQKIIDFLPMGVVSKGKVFSVYLGFQKSHRTFKDFLKEEIESLKKKLLSIKFESFSKVIFSFSENKPFTKNIPPLVFTKASQTSVELTKIFMYSLIGEKNYSEMLCKPQKSKEPIRLLIGDEALAKRDSFDSILDLGELWSEVTKLPFVFAVWQMATPLFPNIKKKLLSLASYTQKKMHSNPEAYLAGLPLEKSFPGALTLSVYWKSLFYEVEAEELKGLDLFLELSKKLKFSQAAQQNSVGHISLPSQRSPSFYIQP